MYKYIGTFVKRITFMWLAVRRSRRAFDDDGWPYTARRSKMKNDAQLRARKAVDVIRRESLTIMATWNGNLYKRCLEGVAEFERLRPRVKPATAPALYCSLIGRQAAGQFAAASLDSVLTVLIGETADHK